jgi:hypothetical protein
MDNINRPDGIEFIIETDEGAVTDFIKFSEMTNESLVRYVMKYPYAMTEWMNRLPDIEKEEEARFQEWLKNNETEPEQ